MPLLLPEFQRHVETIWRTVFRLVSNEDDARDVVQQTYLDASGLDPDVIRDWRHVLLKIATRRAFDVLRQRYRQANKPVTDDQAARTTPPEMELQYAELRDTVRQRLSELPENQATAFWLRHMEQLGNAEVSRLLQVSPDHVRVLIHRATEHLRRRLSPDLDTTYSSAAKE